MNLPRCNEVGYLQVWTYFPITRLVYLSFFCSKPLICRKDHRGDTLLSLPDLFNLIMTWFVLIIFFYSCAWPFSLATMSTDVPWSILYPSHSKHPAHQRPLPDRQSQRARRARKVWNLEDFPSYNSYLGKNAVGGIVADWDSPTYL